MKHVLVLGAGMVSRPLVSYLLNRFEVSLADVDLNKAKGVVGNHARARALALDAEDLPALASMVRHHDLVVSFLPPPFHPKVAQVCLELGKHLVTASYVTAAMCALEPEVRQKGLIFLNEMGLDPGLDHMTVMEMIHEVQRLGGSIRGFQSHAGGLPARRYANNSLRYKFSWSPRGVLGALTRPSKYRRHGEVVQVPGENKLKHAEPVWIPGLGVFESNPNADSLYYAQLYGLQDVSTVRRGTLRYPGWAVFWRFMLRWGFLDSAPQQAVDGLTPLEALFSLTRMDPATELKAFLKRSDPEHAAQFMEHFFTLGLMSTRRLQGSFSPFELLLACARDNLVYGENEADLVVLHHELQVDLEDRQETWTSSMIREGVPGGLTAMAELVGLPAAIGVTLILDGKLSEPGLVLPLTPSVYQPVLEELAQLGIRHQTQRVAS